MLNRVTGNDPTQILGSVSSNGGVWLINSHGVLFGQNARIDVAGLVTSTLDISNIDFLAGKYNFLAGGSSPGQVMNQGEVRTTFGGRVWLIGAQVHNEGMIQTPGGNIVLAAGKSLELIDSGAPNVVVRVTAPENAVANLGSLVAASGGSIDVHGSIVNQQGIIRADSVGTDGAGRIVLKASQGLTLAENSVTQSEGGNVTMAAGTTTYLAGLVDVSRQQGRGGSIQLTTGKLEGMASSSLRAEGEQGGHIRVEGSGLLDFSSKLSAIGSSKGGTIEVSGDQVYLRNADLNASGGVQGGTVHVGGGWQGSGNLQHARQVLINTGSELKANGGGSASANSRGGEIAVWSTQSSQHYGLLQARDGGRIEFSSRGSISTQGDIQAGAGGTVLFDPKNLNIINPPPQGMPVENATFAFNPIGTSDISPASITALLNLGSLVTLQANNDIIINADIITTNTIGGGDGGGGNLVLQAGRNITFAANITTGGGNLTAVAGDAAAIAGSKDPGIPTLTIANGMNLNVGTGLATLAAVGGNFVYISGSISPILTTGDGRWLIYTADPGTSTDEAFSSYSKHYNQPFIPGSIPEYASSGNWFFYSVAPILSVAPDSQTIDYGNPIPAFNNPIYSGFIDGDTATTPGAHSGAPTWAIAGATSSSGNLTAGSHDVAYTGGLSSSLGYQFMDNTSSSNELTVLPRPVFVVNPIVENKIYDGTTIATLSGGFLIDAITGGSISQDFPGDSVSASGATAAFNNKNVGDNKAVDLSAGSLAGAEAGNYRPFSNPDINPSITADITPALLAYLADPTVRVTGVPITGLTGRVTGFLSTDTENFDTIGTPIWTTPATATSPAGVYAINGGGLTALNYTFQQAASNATALVLDINPPVLDINPKDKQNTTDTSVQTFNTAMAGALPLYDPYIQCRVNDRVSPVDPDFGRLNLASMSRTEMQLLVESRKEFKGRLFADAICKLEAYPKLAEVPRCSTLAEVDSGSCKVTPALLKEHETKIVLAEEPHKRYRKSLARLPQIERKFTVLFGIDQYTDPTIPPLDNAISDAEVVGKLFADKLGYEVRVARNATKADIVRTLNQLAMEMQPQDSVTIYYAGHGYLDERTASGYWIPADASVSDPRSWVSNADISSMLSLIRSKQVVMISDSCYSGAFTKEQKVLLSGGKVNPDEVLAKRSVVVMSSGSDEPVANGGRQGHSIFAWYLMEALRNVDNWQPGTSLFEQVQREVWQSFPQTPQYGGAKSAGHQAGGDYLFEFRQLE